ncbi:DNA excision repair protein ERCC-8 [Entophlyctis sp. JEL0112]|nr:DNA excision repair protein ERCC-8 [Entophlyctis sp. JEL0112]
MCSRRSRHLNSCDSVIHVLRTTRAVTRRWRSLRLCADSRVVPATDTPPGPVSAMAIDPASERFLLAAISPASSVRPSLCVYDLASASALLTPSAVAKSSHAFAISGVNWYPHDSGLFTSASFDKTVRVWDANVMEPVCTFNLKEKVHVHCMSPASISTALIAAAGESAHIRLCDMKTGGYAHVLSGNKPTALAWSPHNEYILVSGSSERSLILWDVRKSNAVLTRSSIPYPNATSNQPRKEFITHTSACVSGIAFNPSGSHFAAVSSDGSFATWQVEAFDVDNGASAGIEFSSGAFALAPRDTIISPPKISRKPANAGSARPAPTKSSSTSAKKASVQSSQILPESLVVAVAGTQIGSEVLFVPTVADGGAAIGMYDLHSGGEISLLQAHFGRCLCIALRHRNVEIFSGGQDGEILRWMPSYMKYSSANDDDLKRKRVEFMIWV